MYGPVSSAVASVATAPCNSVLLCPILSHNQENGEDRGAYETRTPTHLSVVAITLCRSLALAVICGRWGRRNVRGAPLAATICGLTFTAVSPLVRPVPTSAVRFAFSTSAAAEAARARGGRDGRRESHAARHHSPTGV